MLVKMVLSFIREKKKKQNYEPMFIPKTHKRVLVEDDQNY